MQNFDEQRAEARVINVEVVMVDVDRLVAVELKLPVDFLPVESQRPLPRPPRRRQFRPEPAAGSENWWLCRYALCAGTGKGVCAPAR